MTTTIAPEQGERGDLPKLGTRYLIRGAGSGGRFALVEPHDPAAGARGPTHVHETEDEYSFVLSGRMGAQAGDEVIEAGPGWTSARGMSIAPVRASPAPRAKH